MKKSRTTTIDDDHDHEHDEKPSDQFMSTLTDDLLLEIFLRLPGRPILIQCSIVCKRWFSLISRTQFILRFNQFRCSRRHYNYSNTSLPFEILFSYNQRPKFHKLLSQNINQNSKITNDAITGTLDFLPFSNVVIRASFDDLLLVSRQGSFKHYYICNLFTRQWLALPEILCGNLLPSGYGFICKPNERSNNIIEYSYMVVLLSKCEFYMPGVYSLQALIFFSEIGKWFDISTLLPHSLKTVFERPIRSAFHDMITSNGVLYWLGGQTKLKGIMALDTFSCDPFNPRHSLNGSRLIHFPVGFSHNWRRVSSKGKVCLGVVSGQLRLLELVKINQACFKLKVWELIDYGDAYRSWLLVHDVKLKRVDELFELAFHPNNGNAIFMVRDRNIYLYEIESEKYQKISEFPYDDYGDNVNKRLVARFLNVFTVTQPLLPTPIPPLVSI